MLLVLTIILVTAALLLLLTALLLAGITMTGRRQTMDEAMAWQSEHYDTSFYDACERETYTVTGAEGYELHVELLKSPGSTRYMILSHGYTDTRAGSLKYARFYLEMGFSCIIYDLRHPGGAGPRRPDRGHAHALSRPDRPRTARRIARRGDHGQRPAVPAGRGVRGRGLRLLGHRERAPWGLSQRPSPVGAL